MRSRAAIATGAATAAMKKDTVNASAIVRASGLKNAPVIPGNRANGRKMMTVDRLDPIKAGSSFLSDVCVGSGSPAS